MARRKQLYESQGKIFFEGPEFGTLVQHFTDFVSDSTAVLGKGPLNNRISEFLMVRLHRVNIQTHFIRSLNMREQLIYSTQTFPLKLLIRNVAAGSFAKRFSLKEGTLLQRPLIEYYYPSSKGGNTLVSEEHITAFGWVSCREMEFAAEIALRTNDFLQGYFMALGLQLLDIELTFGRVFNDPNERLILTDEISPDTCSLLDNHPEEERKKKDEKNFIPLNFYQKIANRLGLLVDASLSSIVSWVFCC